eukprot:scaffold12711_cov120-Isochrysis_galbana.AAC.4
MTKRPPCGTILASASHCGRHGRLGRCPTQLWHEVSGRIFVVHPNHFVVTRLLTQPLALEALIPQALVADCAGEALGCTRAFRCAYACTCVHTTRSDGGSGRGAARVRGVLRVAKYGADVCSEERCVGVLMLEPHQSRAQVGRVEEGS